MVPDTFSDPAGKEIAESANTYRPYNGEEETNHRDPKEILGEIEEGEKKLVLTLGEVKRVI